MKKVIPYIILSISALLGCEYTEQDRSRFYENCMQEQLKTSQNFLDDIAIDCACQNWSLREDIKPRNKKNRQDQYNDELQKCYSKPTKLNKKQRNTLLANCHKLFF